ncbi:glucose-1-phosphate adenylyltransferase [Paramagnetospirillum magneticum]|uniref:Glucose-1-phosphate adenylyltransferase n=1 Tax=Paramagnetospirillum magneticum (strain ATCC 700264 / AMB-1) TaxID=342108 RepID=GLGC_PARM1|nr:glucose-1-phosphate adenylyltransferase [Paramagnetospirillum magneticum]Q2W5G1.1 RecName: Full=Glucose-1-phosphate adenylyltransferase; AltName: Full=ADP-glucose pyrophosphorylase; Short=ADPGlc PPase; AltName: Full=ADP-glucose synthase [Paramagnetospirillum magneticum AMB-1]BAE50914.1 ADP-glucose pyrophosphorylase [Paramagnetospirillum magneticum AMB-1]
MFDPTERGTAIDIEVNDRLRKTLALILAGGRGSRLMDLTDWHAKPAIPFAGKFRIVDFTLSNCINSGIRRIGVLTQYKAHSLLQHIQRGWGFLRGEFNEFIELLPAQQRTQGENWYKGTADAVFQNLDIIHAHRPEHVLVLAGDHVYKMHYGKMLAHHLAAGADVTVACIEVPLETAKGFGVMAVDEDDRVIRFDEKPDHPQPMPGHPDQALASMGIYIFNAQLLFDLLQKDSINPETSHDFGKDIIPSLVKSHRVIAHHFQDSCVMHEGAREHYWRDVGTIDAYWEANIDLTTVTPALNLYDESWPIWTDQPQSPPAKFVFDSEHRRGMAVDSLVAGGCIVSGAVVRRSMLFSNVRVNSFCVVEDAVILPNVDIGRHARLKRCIVDQGVVVPPGLVVGEDPVLDAKRFHRTEKGITLVTAEKLKLLGA